MHITRDFRLHYLSGNFGPFELKEFLVVKIKGIDVHICRRFLVDDFLRVIPFIKLFCASNAYPAIHYVHLCQVIGEHEECELAYFFFHYKSEKASYMWLSSLKIVGGNKI